MRSISRRAFSKLMTSAAASSLAAPLGLLNARIARAQGCEPASFAVPGFGPLAPSVPRNTATLADVAGAGDLSGEALIALPEGFEYTAISVRGQPMTDGNAVPADHDGMAAFAGPEGRIVLVRNHEISIGETRRGTERGCTTANGRQYDAFQGQAAGFGGGGTSTVVVGPDGLVVRDFVSLGGTATNCAGGPTPWGSWLSCEEDIATPAINPRATKPHGYVFEVPFGAREAVDPVPLAAFGRMKHEAVSVDPRDGTVYLTEDQFESAYYKLVPRRRPEGVGDYEAGGDLYALAIRPNQRSRCNGEPLPTGRFAGTEVVDTRGRSRGVERGMLAFLGQPLACDWIRLEDVDPAEDTLRSEAQQKGASVFFRGEGAVCHDGRHYFVCTNAGDAGNGQIWRYDPEGETLTLVVESTDENLLEGSDNLTAAADGTLYICEDGAEGEPGQASYSQRVVGVDRSGGLFDFCQNLISTRELCGACFSPDGRFFFVNGQGIGITYAIRRTDGRPISLG